MRVIAVANEKGGTGRTTTAVNLATCCAARGVRTVLLDLDQQASATRLLGLPSDPAALGLNLAHVLDPEPARRAALADTRFDTPYGFAFAPASAEIRAVQEAHIRQPAPSYALLAGALAAPELAGDFDLALIDTPPGLGWLLLTALRAADDVLVPCEPSLLSVEGLAHLVGALSVAREELGGRAQVLGLILARVRTEGVPTREVRHTLATLTGLDEQALLFTAELREYAGIATAAHLALRDGPAGRGGPIVHAAPHSPGAAQFWRLARELDARLQALGVALPFTWEADAAARTPVD